MIAEHMEALRHQLRQERERVQELERKLSSALVALAERDAEHTRLLAHIRDLQDDNDYLRAALRMER